jgi:hypothetical protein
MDSFEACLFAGLDLDQYNCLWVEHRDKGRLELNFVIPNIELTTGKRLQPYYHSADTKRVDAWRTIQNLTYGSLQAAIGEQGQRPSQRHTAGRRRDYSRFVWVGVIRAGKVP